MSDALFLALLITALFAGVVVLVAEERARRRREARWQTVRLTFGRDVTAEAVVSVLSAVSGLRHGRTVALEVRAQAAGVAHYLSTDPGALQALRGSMSSILPSLRLEPAGEIDRDFSHGRLLRLRGRMKVLRSDELPVVAAGLLAALQPLGRDEQLVLRWLIEPARPEPIPRSDDGTTADERRLLRRKNEGAVLRAAGVVAAKTGYRQRAFHLLGRVSAVVRTRSTAYGFIRSRPVRGAALERWLSRRRLGVAGDRYSASELAGLLAWPIDAPALPGIKLGTSPLLMPSEVLPRAGRVLGTATWPGAERRVAQPVVGALSHTLIAGPTGVGKSVLLTNLVLGDIAAGRGVLLIDGKGDTAEAVLDRLPRERLRDVLVLDCTSDGAVPGLRLFTGDAPQLTADVVLGVLTELFHDSWGPLSERYLRAGLTAIAHDAASTFADLPYVFSDTAYRRRLIARLDDPFTRATFAALEAMKPAERAYQLAAPLNKLSSLLGRPTVRTVLGQEDPALDLRRVMARRRIVLINVNPARIGGPAARLIAALVVHALFQATLGRGRLPAEQRSPFFVYLDEPKSLGHVPMPLDSLFDQARGLGVGLTLAPQSVSQLPSRVRDAVLTNVASRLVFRSHAEDARLLARDLPAVDAERLGDLGPFELVARIALGPGQIAAPVTIRTHPLSQKLHDGRRLARQSNDRFGQTPATVDEALRRRHAAGESAPVGRVRRSS
jgi:hypothetical protein